MIIGILIALSLDGVKEKRSHEKKVNRILVEIQRDIVQNMEGTEKKVELFVLRDYMKNMLFKNLLTRDNVSLAESTFGFLPYIFFLPGEESARNIGYAQFVKKIEGLSSQYDELVKELDVLNRYYEEAFEQEAIRYNEIVEQLRHYAYDNTSWFAEDQFSGDLSNEAIQFLIGDKIYKDYVMKQADVAVSEIGVVFDYRQQATKVFSIIEGLLGEESLPKPSTIRYSSLDQADDFKKYLGSYEYVAGPNKNNRCSVIEIYKDNTDLFAVCSRDTTILTYGLSQEGVFGYDQGYLRLFVFDDHTTLLPIAKSILGSPIEGKEIKDGLTIIDGITDASIWRRVN